ncbi:DedA family protein [Gracilimonas mengyeensis]|uniref:Membrane protein DedA, SNARE-associated domain n=1 Tax=Gracilimonas mengyeensis TaxID=1302730 RepID=A0A521FKQ7_9BACT|nr:DedA family protein [Gracilimonas mengyeensis]SMO96071.1 membrane protein DedA, SNARE-associated domain [Gracilimonas mengyeensis]
MADQIVQGIVDWIEVVPPIAMYLMFFAIAYIENLLPPIPGDVIVAFGGYLAAEGVIQLFPVWSLTVVASVAGFMTMYWLGFIWGEQIENNRESHLLLRFLDYKHFRRGKRWMLKWGQGVVMANRFLAGTRSVIALTAGMSRLRIWPTTLSSLLSSVLWNTLLLAMGWVIRDNWQIIGEYLSNYGKIILGLIVLFIAMKFASYWRTKSKAKKLEKD